MLCFHINSFSRVKILAIHLVSGYIASSCEFNILFSNFVSVTGNQQDLLPDIRGWYFTPWISCTRCIGILWNFGWICLKSFGILRKLSNLWNIEPSGIFRNLPEILPEPLGSSRISRNRLESHRIFREFLWLLNLDSSRIFWNPFESLGIFWYLLEYFENSWNLSELLEYFGILWILPEYFGISCSLLLAASWQIVLSLLSLIHAFL